MLSARIGHYSKNNPGNLLTPIRLAFSLVNSRRLIILRNKYNRHLVENLWMGTSYCSGNPGSDNRQKKLTPSDAKKMGIAQREDKISKVKFISLAAGIEFSAKPFCFCLFCL
jgi:hypothetical protein